MEIIDTRRTEDQLLSDAKEQVLGNINILENCRQNSRGVGFLLQQPHKTFISRNMEGEKEEEKQSNGSQYNSSDEDRSNDELKQAIKFKQDKYRVEIRNKKNKQTLQSKRKVMLQTFQQHLQNIQGVRLQTEANKENQYKQASEEFRQQTFEKSIQALSHNYFSNDQEQLENILEDIYILMRIDHKFVGSTNHIQLCFFLIEILKTQTSSNNNIIKCVQIICSMQDFFQLELSQPTILINVLNHQSFIQTLSQLISTPISSSINVQNNILYALYVFTERDNKFVDDIVNEQIIEKCVRNFDITQSSAFTEQFEDTTWIYLLALYSNLAQHSKFPKHLNYFKRNINLFINMLRLHIEDEQSNQIFKYQILKSLSYLMRKETNFVSIFEGSNDYIQLIQKQVIEYSTNYPLFQEIIDIVSCVTSVDDEGNLIYKLIFDFSLEAQNPEQNVQNENQFFLFNAMITCLNEKVDINIDQKIYITLLNTLLSGNLCLQKCKEFKLAHKLVKILQTEQNEQSYSNCLEVIRSYVILMDEDKDYNEIIEISNTPGFLHNYFNQTSHFQQQTLVLQLCLLQSFLYAGDKVKNQQPNRYSENPVVVTLQKYHQLEYIDQFQLDQNTQIYQICSQIISQYIDNHLD